MKALRAGSASELRRRDEAMRIEDVRARGRVPEGCGPEIPDAPARGPVRRFQPMGYYPVGSDGWAMKATGHMGRAALRRADVFDVMAARAARHAKPAPFTPSQVQVGRDYRDVVERHASAGVRCSSMEAQSGGGGGGGAFIDAVLRDGERIALLRGRVGGGQAMCVRRVRPSARGSRLGIADMVLVDMVCLRDLALGPVLKAHGWSVWAGSLDAVRQALCAALDRMTGPVRSGSVMYCGTRPGMVWRDDGA